MTAHEFCCWLQTLADSEALVPATEVLKRLPDAATQSHEAAGDLTLAEMAAEVGRAVSTVRSWCNSKRIAGAYRLNGRDWRIPRTALRRFLDDQGRADAQHEVQHGDVDWDSWKT